VEEFQTIQPSPLLAQYVSHYWFLKTDDVAGGRQRIIPTGNVCIVFHRATRMYSVSENQNQPRAFVAGQSTGYYDLLQNGFVDMVVIAFQPYAARFFFPLPIYELQNNVISINDINDKLLVELQDRLNDEPDNFLCVRLIESYLLKRLYISKEYDYRRVSSVIQSINKGQTDIELLAQTACLSYKQFQRVFREYVGTNPKDFLRIVRFQKALYTLQTDTRINFTRLSAECGYFDQSHLIKDFKIFSGYTPGEFVSLCAPYSDYFS